MSTGESVYRFILEDGGGDGSPAPPVRPGQAQAAERDDRGSGPRPAPGPSGDQRRNPMVPREQPGESKEGKSGLDKLADGLRKFEQASRVLQDLGRGRFGSGTIQTAADLAGRYVPRAGSKPPTTNVTPSAPKPPPQVTPPPMPATSVAGAPPIGSLPVGTAVPPVAPGGIAGAGATPAVPAAAGAAGEAAGGTVAAGAALSAGAMVAVGALAVVAAGAIALGAAFVSANKKAKEFTEQLAGYSAVIAASKAQSDIRRLRQDIENAKIVGQAVAARTASEARADAANSKSGAIIEKRLLEISQFAYDFKAWASEGSAAIVSKLDEGISTLMKVAEELPIIGDRIKKAHDEDKAATEKAAAMAGSLDVLFQDIPDIDISDAGSPGANLERQNVAFSAFGGEQRELP